MHACRLYSFHNNIFGKNLFSRTSFLVIIPRHASIKGIYTLQISARNGKVRTKKSDLNFLVQTFPPKCKYVALHSIPYEKFRQVYIHFKDYSRGCCFILISTLKNDTKYNDWPASVWKTFRSLWMRTPVFKCCGYLSKTFSSSSSGSKFSWSVSLSNNGTFSSCAWQNKII